MKKTLLALSLFSLTILLTGCQAITSNDGFFHVYLVNPFTKILEFNADFFDGNYGLAIILMTIIIRFVLLPLTMKQYKTQKTMKSKMEVMKPEMTVIQEKIKQTKDQTKQQELQKEMMMLYKKHEVNPLNMGCLPILIQMPILMGFYYAIRGSHEIATHSFLWFNLGQANIPMALIAGVIYYFQSRVSLRQMPVEQQKNMKIMGLLSPLMILFVSYSAPAALPLYWSVGGLFMIAQTYLLQKFYNREKPSKALETETAMKK